MKTKIVELGIIVLKVILKTTYFFLKALPVNDKKVLFCSRQMAELPLDFKLLQDRLTEDKADIKIVNICQPIGRSLGEYFLFVIALFRSMYHLATCRVCILDTYWPAVSLLKHKKDLTVIQIWHAIGKIKKSGYASAGKRSGRKAEHAKKLHMHENYDYVIAGAKEWNKYYCESFGIEEDIILNYGLPRIDYLLDTEKINRERFFEENPEMKSKKIVLYAPTFRRNMKSSWDKIVALADNDDILLIIKTHPGERKVVHLDHKDNIKFFDNWKTIDLIAVCDYLVTDYSAIALEGAVLNKKTFFWTYDYDKYVKNNGLNIDLYGTVPMHIFEEVEELREYIEKDRFDNKAFSDFRKRYLPHELYGSTEKIAKLVLDKMN